MKKKTFSQEPVISANLNATYDLVITDLFKKLIKLKDKGIIKLGELGTLYKKHRLLESALDGRIYSYYQISFKASAELKKALDR